MLPHSIRLIANSEVVEPAIIDLLLVVIRTILLPLTWPMFLSCPGRHFAKASPLMLRCSARVLVPMQPGLGKSESKE